MCFCMINCAIVTMQQKQVQNAVICISKCIFCLQQLIMAFNGHNVVCNILFIFIIGRLIDEFSLLCVCFCSDAKERTTRSFSVGGVFNYTSLLLSKEDNMLYVGAREILFALNLSDISAVKLQRNVRANVQVSVNHSTIYSVVYQYECSYNVIPEVLYEYSYKYDMIPEVQCDYNTLRLQSECFSLCLSCSSHGKLQRGKEKSAVSKGKTCRWENGWCKAQMAQTLFT